MKSLLASLIFFGVLTVAAQSQPVAAYNTTLFGTLDPDIQKQGTYSALTGYAAPDGREYALLGGFTGTYVIDVTEAPLKLVSFIPGPTSLWREMKTWGSYGYVVSEGGSGLQIIDLTQLPLKAFLLRADTAAFRTAHTISVEGNHLYVNGTNVEAGANQGTLIFDLSVDPTRPRLVGKWTGRYVHDCSVRNDTLYAAAINDGQLDIVYLGKDRKSPVQVANIQYPGAGTHNAEATTDGRYILTSDEVGSTPKTLKVWDRTNIQSIKKVADWTPVPGEIIHNVHIKGNHAFIAWYTAGTRVVDITDPANPVQVGYYDTYPEAGEFFAGNWGTYPYLPSGKILSSDMQTGLHVFTFNGATPGRISGRVIDALTNKPIPFARVDLTDLKLRLITDSLGRYTFAGAADSLNWSASIQDYLPRSGKFYVDPKGAQFDIYLSKLPLADLTLRVVDDATNQPIPNVGWRLSERSFAEGVSPNGFQTFSLPSDSTYQLFVGAWGYRTKLVPFSSKMGTTQEVRLKRGYHDNAEVDLGWAVGDASDDAVSGGWERGVPIGTVADIPRRGKTQIQPDSDQTADPGDHAFVTGITGTEGTNIGAADVDNGTTRLTSPTFDLSGWYDPYITANIWYSRGGNLQGIDDTLRVFLSSDNGKTWSLAAELTDSADAWKRYEYRVRDYAELTSQMLFRIEVSDLERPSLVEAAMDEFEIEERGDPTGVEATPATTEIAATLQPNPLVAGEGQVVVQLPHAASELRVELFGAQGQRVLQLYAGKAGAGVLSFPLNAASIPAGSYQLTITANGKTWSRGVVVVK
ncbi:MAG: choice-of-anchor B family protein [Candidatus Kapabacteria bacterium]|nr:choice-of-anchor B family protein [Candidatus Kapabacteria bacterium]